LELASEQGKSQGLLLMKDQQYAAEIAALQAHNVHLSLELASEQEKSQGLLEKDKQYEVQNKELHLALREQEASIASAQRELAEARVAHEANLATAKQELNAQLALKDSKLQERSQHEQALRAQLSAELEKRTGLLSAAEVKYAARLEAQRNASKLELEREKLQLRDEFNQEKNDALRQKESELQMQLRETTSPLEAALAAKEAELTKHAADTLEQVAKLQQENVAIRASLAEKQLLFEEDLNSKEDDQKRLELKLQKVEAAKSGLEIKVAEVQAELGAQNAQLQEIIQALQAELQKAQDLEQTKSKMGELLAQKETLDTEIGQLVEERNKVYAQVQTWTTHMTELLAVHNSNQAIAAELDERTKNLEVAAEIQEHILSKRETQEAKLEQLDREVAKRELISAQMGNINSELEQLKANKTRLDELRREVPTPTESFTFVIENNETYGSVEGFLDSMKTDPVMVNRLNSVTNVINIYSRCPWSMKSINFTALQQNNQQFINVLNLMLDTRSGSLAYAKFLEYQDKFHDKRRGFKTGTLTLVIGGTAVDQTITSKWAGQTTERTWSSVAHNFRGLSGDLADNLRFQLAPDTPLSVLLAFVSNRALMGNLSNVTIDIDVLYGGKHTLLLELDRLDEVLERRFARAPVKPLFETRLYTTSPLVTADSGGFVTWDLLDRQLFNKPQSALQSLGQIYINNSPVVIHEARWKFKWQVADWCDVDGVKMFFRAQAEIVPNEAKDSVDNEGPAGVREFPGVADIKDYHLEDFVRDSRIAGKMCARIIGSSQKQINIKSKCPLPVDAIFTTQFLHDMQECRDRGKMPFLNFTNLLIDVQQVSKEHFANLQTHYRQKQIDRLTVVVGFEIGEAEAVVSKFAGISTVMARDFRLQLAPYMPMNQFVLFCRLTNLVDFSNIAINVDQVDLGLLYGELKILNNFLQAQNTKGRQEEFTTWLYTQDVEYIENLEYGWFNNDERFELDPNPTGRINRAQDFLRFASLGNIYVNNIPIEKANSLWVFNYQKMTSCDYIGKNSQTVYIFNR
jgi:hypothetical protein